MVLLGPQGFPFWTTDPFSGQPGSRVGRLSYTREQSIYWKKNDLEKKGLLEREDKMFHPNYNPAFPRDALSKSMLCGTNFLFSSKTYASLVASG